MWRQPENNTTWQQYANPTIGVTNHLQWTKTILWKLVQPLPISWKSFVQQSTSSMTRRILRLFGTCYYDEVRYDDLWTEVVQHWSSIRSYVLFNGYAPLRGLRSICWISAQDLEHEVRRRQWHATHYAIEHVSHQIKRTPLFMYGPIASINFRMTMKDLLCIEGMIIISTHIWHFCTFDDL